MSLGYEYDMVLLPPKAPSTDGDITHQQPRRGRRPSRRSRRARQAQRGRDHPDTAQVQGDDPRSACIPCPAVGTESLAGDLYSLSLGKGKTSVARSNAPSSSSAPPPPEELSSFITPFDMYCYVTMPCGLRNAGATYQRCTTQVFGEHIG